MPDPEQFGFAVWRPGFRMSLAVPHSRGEVAGVASFLGLCASLHPGPTFARLRETKCSVKVVRHTWKINFCGKLRGAGGGGSRVKVPTLVPPKNGVTRMGHPPVLRTENWELFSKSHDVVAAVDVDHFAGDAAAGVGGEEDTG